LAEREIFQREFSRGAYRAAAYTVSSSVVYFPFLFTLGLVYTAISWWLVGLPNQAAIFFFQVLIVWLVTVAGHTFSTMISVLVPNPMAGQTAGSALFSVMFLYSGFFINSSQIPKYWIWLNYLSLFKWGYDSMITNAFKDYAYYDDAIMGQATNQDVLSQYGESRTDKTTGVAVLIAFIVFFRLVFYYRLVTAFNGSRK
jgi:ATP-binding cassette subfamily G (WHITE) protein 2